MGRHRKPSSSSISVAKIAVTGAVIGTGSLGMAGAAQAASDSEWDTVAGCESSGNWAINTGNGYQGGLQFSPSTWLGYGGGQFASAAHLASKDQQIAIAEKVLAGQGRGAWPVCGRGLSGPTPRTLSSQTAPKPTTPAADASQPAAALKEKEAAPGAPAPEAPAAPAPDAPTIGDVETVTVGEDATPKGAVETVSVEDKVVEDQIVAVGGELAGDAPAPAVVPADYAAAPNPGPVPVVPAKSAPAAAATATPGSTAAVVPASSSTTTVAADQAPVQHLPSPHNPPPGTSDEPVGPTSNANVSYLKELWHAVQNQEIDRSDLMLALASRSLNSPVQSDADPAPVVVADAPAAS